uniref:tRNA (32-2'-O)-methyltransferase regulator THADA n=1 Tax=Hirondellea gigas TaxID=1518452 RepID=A0A6A7FT53_9CRUS
MDDQTTILKKNKVRVCNIIPIIINMPNCAELKDLQLLCNQLQNPSNGSSQAVAVTQIVEACSNDTDVRFTVGLQILTAALLQCPLKTNLSGKILGCLNRMRQSRVSLYEKEATRILLSCIDCSNEERSDDHGCSNATNSSNPEKLCQMLTIIQKTGLFQATTADSRQATGNVKNSKQIAGSKQTNKSVQKNNEVNGIHLVQDVSVLTKEQLQDFKNNSLQLNHVSMQQDLSNKQSQNSMLQNHNSMEQNNLSSQQNYFGIQQNNTSIHENNFLQQANESLSRDGPTYADSYAALSNVGIIRYADDERACLAKIKTEVHEALCKAVASTLDTLFHAAFDNSGYYVSASASQQALHQLLTCLMHYMQPLVVVVPPTAGVTSACFGTETSSTGACVDTSLTTASVVISASGVSSAGTDVATPMTTAADIVGISATGVNSAFTTSASNIKTTAVSAGGDSTTAAAAGTAARRGSYTHTPRLSSYNNRHIVTIMRVILSILNSSNSTLDLRLISGQLFAVLAKFCKKGPLVIIEAMTDMQNTSKETIDTFSICDNNVTLPVLLKLGRLALFHGVLCTIPANQLFITRVTVGKSDSYEKSRVLGMVILEQTLQLGHSSDDSELVLSCARLLNHWTLRVLSDENNSNLMVNLIPVDGEFEIRLLEHLWFTWEHYLDRVKHTTHETFMNLLEMRRIGLCENAEKYFMLLIQKQMHQVPQKKSSVNAVKCLIKHVSVRKVLANYSELPSLLVKSLCDFSRAGCSAELLKALFSKHATEVSIETWQNYWIPTLFDKFTADMMTYGFEVLVKNLLLANPACVSFVIDFLLNESGDLNYDRSMLLHSCVKVIRNSKECNIETSKEYSSAGSSERTWRNLLPYSAIRSGLVHVDERVQISTFGLLCESKKTAEAFETEELQLILFFFDYGFNIDVPSQRQVLLSFAKKLFIRVRESTNAFRRLLESKKKRDALSLPSNDCENVDENVAAYTEFCRQLFQLLLSNLHSSSSYPRRVCSLSLLQLFQDIVLNNQIVDVLNLRDLNCNTVYIHTLIDCFNDNYESNKLMALELLQNNTNVYGLILEKDVVAISSCAIEMASSCKPTDSLTASYLFKCIQDHPLLSKALNDSRYFQCLSSSLFICEELLSRLEDEVATAKLDLLEATSSKPMYGLLSCIRSVLNDVKTQDFKNNHKEWTCFISKLIDICFMARNTVRTIVENDSPEGNIPMDLSILQTVVSKSIGSEGNEANIVLSSECSPQVFNKAKSVSAQMLLICAWRTVKEISLIFGYLLHALPLPPAQTAAIDVATITQIGEYFLSVLAETKHRGAFEQAYTGFLMLCDRLWLCKQKQLNTLPEKWLLDVLQAIEAETEEKFCATRRSAGVPFIIQALLSTEPTTHGNIHLKKTIATLLSYAASKTQNKSYTRLHAFNILRALYKDTNLGDVVIPYVSDGVKAAIDGFSCTWWSIRNSATLLFAALITRMLGVKKIKDDLHSKNAMSGLVFFRRFPDLYGYLLDKLKAGACDILEGKLTASLYPVLLLLARLSPAPLEGVTSSICLANFVPFVISCTKSQIFQLRVLASRALGPLVTVNHLKKTLSVLCDQACSAKQNEVHGALLSILQLLGSFCSRVTSEEQKSCILSDLTSLVALATHENPCLLTQAVAVDLFSILLQQKWLAGNSEVFASLYQCTLKQVCHHTSNYEIMKHVPGFTHYEKSANTFLLEQSKIRSNNDSEELILTLLLSSQSAEVRTLAMNDILQRTTKLSTLDKYYNKLMERADYHDCRIAMYKIASRMLKISNVNTDDASEVIKENVRRNILSHQLQLLSGSVLCRTDDNLQVQEEELKYIIILLPDLIIQAKQITEVEFMQRVCSGLLEWSDCSEHTTVVRRNAATAAVMLLHHWLMMYTHHNTAGVQQQPNELVLCSLLECVIQQLQDDDNDVRCEAAKCWSTLLALASSNAYYHHHHSETPAQQQPDRGPLDEHSWSCRLSPKVCSPDSGTPGVTLHQQKPGNVSRYYNKNPSVLREVSGDGLNTFPALIVNAAGKAVIAAVGTDLTLGDILMQITAMRPAQVLYALLHFIGNIGSRALLSLLFTLCLKENNPAKFGLTEDDDRAFDKGEANIHAEEVILSGHAAEVLSTIPDIKQAMIDAAVVSPHIFVVSSEGNSNKCIDPCYFVTELPAQITVSLFLEVLSKEILYVSAQLAERCVSLPQFYSTADVWLVRLARRAALWAPLYRSCYDAHQQSSDVEKILPSMEKLLVMPSLQTALVQKISKYFFQSCDINAR